LIRSALRLELALAVLALALLISATLVSPALAAGESPTQDEAAAEGASPVPAGAEADSEQSETQEEAGGGLMPVLSRFGLRIYGRVYLDMAYDSAKVDTGNFARWVETPDEAGRDDAQFNVSANASRLGVAITGPGSKNIESDALVEIDFYGGGGENTPKPRLRHAYASVSWLKPDITLLFGQTWDIVHPLIPEQLNYAAGWWSGNIGYRRPQLRIGTRFALKGGGRLALDLAVTRTIGDPIFTEDVGADSGIPTLQAHVGYEFLGLAGEAAGIGFSGHAGEQECDSLAKDFVTWSAGTDLSIPFSKKLRLEGEAWTGQAVCTYLAGIGQGVNTDLRRAIRATGGWASLKYDLSSKWRFNLGGGIDDPWNRDLSPGMRSQNYSVFTNAKRYFFNRAFSVGLELMYLHTEYIDRSTGTAFRVQGQGRFDF